MNKILIALMAGVAVGILIAPDKGSATRDKLIDGFNDWADKFDGLREKFISDVTETVNEQSLETPKMSATV